MDAVMRQQAGGATKPPFANAATQDSTVQIDSNLQVLHQAPSTSPLQSFAADPLSLGHHR